LPIHPGTPTPGSISSSDPRADQRHYDDYRLTLREGDVVQIDMESEQSEQIDPYLEIFGPNSNQPLAANDDRDTSTLDSRLVFTAPAAGDYIVRAQEFYFQGGGYRLSVQRLPSAPQPIPLVQGRRVDGIIGNQSSVISDEGRPYRYVPYVFEGRAGARVRLDMRAANLDSRLQLVGRDGTVIERNDDGGRLRNARIVAVLPEDGRYIVRASAPSTQAGSYNLELRLAPPEGEHSPTELRVGESIDQELGGVGSGVVMRRGDRARINFFYNIYALPVAAGDTIIVTMTATGFVPVLEAGSMTVLGFATAVADDDNERGHPAELVLRPMLQPGQRGVIHLRARALGSNTGTFRLTTAASAGAASTSN